MDAFFASVEQLDAPELRGKPVLVGHDGPRGVVAAASYESRVYGCRSAQPMMMAKRMCPNAIVVRPRFYRYRELSNHVFEIFQRFTPAVQPLSIDEAFLDVSGCERLFGSAEQIAMEIRRLVRVETGLTASVGVAPNKFLAKLASDMNKPDGLTVLRPDELASVLPPMPISRIWGIGPKTAERLEQMGIRTFGDLSRANEVLLKRAFGEEADRYRRLAIGLDERPVVNDRQAKSIGQEQTFGSDLDNPDDVRAVMLEQTEQVGERLRRHGMKAGAVTVKIRFGDFETITRSRTLPAPSDITADLWQAAKDLFNAWAVDFRPVRLIGVSAKSLAGEGGQLELFADPGDDRRRRLDQTLDSINGRFGKATIHRATPSGRRRKE